MEYDPNFETELFEIIKGGKSSADVERLSLEYPEQMRDTAERIGEYLRNIKTGSPIRAETEITAEQLKELRTNIDRARELTLLHDTHQRETQSDLEAANQYVLEQNSIHSVVNREKLPDDQATLSQDCLMLFADKPIYDFKCVLGLDDTYYLEIIG